MPTPIEPVLRQFRGIAWREAQGKLPDGRAARGLLREGTEWERGQMLAEVGRLDARLEAGLSRRLAEHDRVIVDKGQVLALIPGESLGHMGCRASQQLRCGGPILPEGWPGNSRGEGRVPTRSGPRRFAYKGPQETFERHLRESIQDP